MTDHSLLFLVSGVNQQVKALRFTLAHGAFRNLAVMACINFLIAMVLGLLLCEYSPEDKEKSRIWLRVGFLLLSGFSDTSSVVDPGFESDFPDLLQRTKRFATGQRTHYIQSLHSFHPRLNAKWAIPRNRCFRSQFFRHLSPVGITGKQKPCGSWSSSSVSTEDGVERRLAANKKKKKIFFSIKLVSEKLRKGPRSQVGRETMSDGRSFIHRYFG